MRLVLFLIATLSAASIALYLVDLSRISFWAIEAQRGFQNQMAGAIRAIKAGDVGAYAALFGATAAYGFVHALGPGHGKYLIGGVGVGSSVSVPKLVGLATASSLVQSLWAIILVYGGFTMLEVSASKLTTLAESFLAPVSYLAIAGIGLLFIWRGISAVQVRHAPSDHHCNCGGHGPTPNQVAGAKTLREAVGSVFSIAIRPCTGAIFLLVIAWQMDLATAGAIAVLSMGLGTAALTSAVAVSSVAARNVAVFSMDRHSRWGVVLPAIQVFSGAIIAVISLSMLGMRLD